MRESRPQSPRPFRAALDVAGVCFLFTQRRPIGSQTGLPVEAPNGAPDRSRLCRRFVRPSSAQTNAPNTRGLRSGGLRTGRPGLGSPEPLNALAPGPLLVSTSRCIPGLGEKSTIADGRGFSRACIVRLRPAGHLLLAAATSTLGKGRRAVSCWTRGGRRRSA